MKKLLPISIALFLLVPCSLARAQNRPAIELSAGPSVDFRVLSIAKDYRTSDLVKDERRRRNYDERPGRGWYAAVSYRRPLGRTLAVRGGLRWSQLRYDGVPGLVPVTTHWIVTGWCATPDLQQWYYRSRARYLHQVQFNAIELPLALSASRQVGPLRLMAEGGLSPAYLYHAAGEWTSGGEDGAPVGVTGWQPLTESNHYHNLPLRRLQVFGTLALGVGCAVNEQWDFAIRPTLRYGLQPLQFATDLKENLASVAVEFGAQCKLQ
jgi:hypothetical protein